MAAVTGGEHTHTRSPLISCLRSSMAGLREAGLATGFPQTRAEATMLASPASPKAAAGWLGKLAVSANASGQGRRRVNSAQRARRRVEEGDGRREDGRGRRPPWVSNAAENARKGGRRWRRGLLSKKGTMSREEAGSRRS